MNITYEFESELRKYVERFRPEVTVPGNGTIQIRQSGRSTTLKFQVERGASIPVHQR